MNINCNFTPTTFTNRTFKNRTASIPTERILELLNSGKPVKVIKSELGIALDTFYKLLRERGIEYNKQKLSPKLAQITKEQIEGFHQAKTPVETICKELGINESAYYKLLETFGLKSPQKLKIEQGAQITKNLLEDCITKYKTVAERCRTLGITENVYYKLVQKFEVLTPYKKRVQETSQVKIEDILALKEQGMSAESIIKKLNISQGIYNKLLSRNGIITKAQATKQKVAQVTKEQIEALLNSNKKVAEICEELGLNIRTYSRLLDKFGITTARKKSKLANAAVTKEELQRLVDQKLSPDEISSTLGISKASFYTLLKLLKIDYDYLHHSNEIVIPKRILEEAASSNKTIEEIAKELKISGTTYNEKAKIAEVDTKYRKSIDKISAIDKDEIQAAINSGKSVKEICEEFNITRANYLALQRKHNLYTPQREAVERSSQITPAQLKELLSADKTVETICEELGISQRTFYRILNRKA